MQCLAERKTIELIKIERRITLDSAIAAKKNYLLIRDNEESTIRAVTGIILMASSYFNVKPGMDESQAVQTASYFLESYPYETIEDLILCLKKAKSGIYGKLYNRIDGEIIFTWFRTYLDEKYERVEHIKQNEKFENAETASNQISGPTADFIKKVLEKSTQKKNENLKPKADSIEDHFKKFIAALELYDKSELTSLKSYYKMENKKMGRPYFDNYIKAIDEKIDLLNQKP